MKTTRSTQIFDHFAPISTGRIAEFHSSLGPKINTNRSTGNGSTSAPSGPKPNSGGNFGSSSTHMKNTESDIDWVEVILVTAIVVGTVYAIVKIYEEKKEKEQK